MRVSEWVVLFTIEKPYCLDNMVSVRETSMRSKERLLEEMGDERREGG